MRAQFAGYFSPSDSEFTELWKNCVFAFDANVLLGLYRSTTETQKVFFDVLERVADRIFLPHQAAREYLRHRLNVISVRSDSFGKISAEAEKLAKFTESTAQEHALRKGKELIKIAKEAAEKIQSVVSTALNDEPNLLHSDDVMEKLAALFEKCTGEPYQPTKFTELCVEAATRYSKGIPPGFKDDKKPEPDKFGDALIWFQLLDYAKSNKKPIIFITGDVKEDWWQQHKGETLGPRPELRQEMMEIAKVQFYMYTAPRFLEFAKQFLRLGFDTKKAESELEKIEKQDKEAAEWFSVTSADSQTYAYESPQYRLNTTYPVGNFGWWGQPQGMTFSLPDPEEAKNKNTYFTLLPVHGQMYHTSTATWKCEITGIPDRKDSDNAVYTLSFEPSDHAKGTRHLRLSVSIETLEKDSDWRYKSAISRAILRWLEMNQRSGEISFAA